MSPVLSKVLESIILRRLQDIMPLLNIPDILQTAYQKGLSCIDATFATPEALLIHLREGGHPYLCLFDLEKAFDSVKLPVLLKSLFQVGINGKCWRLLNDWYLNAQSRVYVNGSLSRPLSINRGVKQGSILSPLLFIIVIDPLLKKLRNINAGLSVNGTYVGAAAHADDLRTAATYSSMLFLTS